MTALRGFKSFKTFQSFQAFEKDASPQRDRDPAEGFVHDEILSRFPLGVLCASAVRFRFFHHETQSSQSSEHSLINNYHSAYSVVRAGSPRPDPVEGRASAVRTPKVFSPRLAIRKREDPLSTLWYGRSVLLVMRRVGKRLNRPDCVGRRQRPVLLSDAPHYAIGHHADQEQL